MAPKASLSALMKAHSLTIRDLAERSGISLPTAYRAVAQDSSKKLSTTSATRIAKALNETVGNINWRGGLSNRGRPAGSGGH